MDNSPASELYMPTFRNTVCSVFTGRKACVEFYTRRRAYEDGTDRVFRNVGIYTSDIEELPKRKRTTFRTRRKFQINKYTVFIGVFPKAGGTLSCSLGPLTFNTELLALPFRWFVVTFGLLLFVSFLD
jgi:hypothetical protein